VFRELEEQIQVVAAITHLNSERLDYEIHVLNKHEEENSVVKSEQKRKITVLQVLSPIVLNI
jgi:dynein regulatory complex protein 1